MCLTNNIFQPQYFYFDASQSGSISVRKRGAFF
jgi:hypothetical protein